jgi:hypothetical protein
VTEQGAVTACEHHGYRRDRDPDACNRANEEAWANPFSGAAPPADATQGISISIRLATSLRDSLSLDNGSPPIAGCSLAGACPPERLECLDVAGHRGSGEIPF